jgi:hypothetical protein
MRYFWLRWWSDAKLERESNLRTEWLMQGCGQGNDREYRDAMNEVLDRRAHRYLRALIAADYRRQPPTAPAERTAPTGKETQDER